MASGAGRGLRQLYLGASLERVQRRKASRRPTVAVKTSNQLALF